MNVDFVLCFELVERFLENHSSFDRRAARDFVTANADFEIYPGLEMCFWNELMNTSAQRLFDTYLYEFGDMDDVEANMEVFVREHAAYFRVYGRPLLREFIALIEDELE